MNRKPLDFNGGTDGGLWDRFATAKFLGISVRKLDDLVQRRLIPSIKLGRSRRFDPQQLRHWLKRQHDEAGAV